MTTKSLNEYLRGNLTPVLSTVQGYLEKGAEANYLGMYRTTLAEASWTPPRHKDTLPIVKLLVESGATLDTKHKGGFTPLHGAATAGNLEVVTYLLEQGANPTIKTEGKESRTPRQYVNSNNHVLIETLRRAETNWNKQYEEKEASPVRI